MGAKLCPKIILEGTRLTHKTDVAFALNVHPRIVGPRKYLYHSPLISGEWCAFTNFPWGRGLINFSSEEEAAAMETYRTWMRLFELQRYYSWIIDRFHISTQVYQKMACGKEYDFLWLEERLCRIGFHIVLLSRTGHSFSHARENRLKVSGKPSQYDDLSVFIREQEMFRAYLGRTLLPWKEFDITDDDVPGVTDRIADWMETTGGLYASGY